MGAVIVGRRGPSRPSSGATVARILVIDGQPDMVELLARPLRGAGHDIRVAKDPDHGRGLIRQAAADLVVIDLSVPGDDAIDMIAELRRDQPGVKIVALSTGWAIGDDTRRRRARAFGADVAVTKFVDPAALIGTIDDLLSGSDSEIRSPDRGA